MGLSPKVSYSGFDGVKVVSISPHGTINQKGAVALLGANWTQANPNNVILVVEALFEYTAITGLELNIDGNKQRFVSTASMTNMNEIGGTSHTVGVQSSTKGFVANVDVVSKILNSNRSWMRITTPSGTAECALNDGPNKSKAYFALKRFAAEVTSIRGQ